MAFAKFKIKKGLTVSDSFVPTGYDEIPVGLILPYSKQTPPSGWLMCDGTSTTGYSELAAIVGATTPNLNGSVIIGRGTGLGAGSSGNGQITGSPLSPVDINTTQGSNTNPIVGFIHQHPMGSHTHDITHTHNYPHTHTFPHFHGTSHTHASPSSFSVSSHQHSSWFSNQLSTGTSGKAANSITGPAGFPTTLGGGHTHGEYTDATPPVGSSGNSWGANGTVNAFGVTATTTTATNNVATGSFGSPSSPSGSFPIIQPIIGVYFIIKY